MTLRVHIIMLCHNGVEYTLACLESLRRQDYPDVEVIVIDNASQDGTPDLVRAAYPTVSLISTGDNLGYAGGNNVGMRTALQRGADAVFLVNNDTLLEANCVSALVSALEADPRIGVVGPMVYTWDAGQTISSAGGTIHWRHAYAANVGAGEVDRGQYPARPVDFINGCGLLITRQAIERIGFLDERYFMYWEETDWCMRIRRAGFDVHFEPAAHMRHKAPLHYDQVGLATLYYLARNRFLFIGTHAPLPTRWIAFAHMLHSARRGVMEFRRIGQIENAQAIKAGILHGLQQHWGRVDPSVWQVKQSVVSPALTSHTREHQS